VFQAVRSWFERRQILRELRVDDGQRGGGYRKYVDEELSLARDVLDCGDRDQARAIWVKLRALDPQAVAYSPAGLRLLLDLGGFDEADAMMRDGHKQHPSHPHFPSGGAQTAYRRGDFEEALRRCKSMRRKFSHIAAGYTIATACLNDLGRLEEAEAMMEMAVRKLPRDLDVLVEYARYAVSRKDWNEAVRRWQLVSRESNDFLGLIGVAQALREMGRYDEAEEKALEAHTRFPKVMWPVVELATIASARGDFDKAVEHYKFSIKEFPFFYVAYTLGAEAARHAGQVATADEILGLAVTRLRSHLGAHLEYARNAHRRCDWPAAVERWALVRDRFPDCDEGREQEAQALTAVGQKS
jgi:tetratricopeptide (TPR) repeat protein